MFEEALRAVGELLGDGGTGTARTRSVELQAADGAALLADWVAELAYIAESSGLVPEHLERLDVRERELSAVVAGSIGEPPPLIKAATYHRLALEQTRSGWRATVVLDV